MVSIPLIPKQAAIAVADLVGNCAKVQPGMNVLIVAAGRLMTVQFDLLKVRRGLLWRYADP